MDCVGCSERTDGHRAGTETPLVHGEFGAFRALQSVWTSRKEGRLYAITRELSCQFNSMHLHARHGNGHIQMPNRFSSNMQILVILGAEILPDMYSCSYFWESAIRALSSQLSK